MIAEGQSNLDGIAIIGLSGRFPGARNVEQFWRNLVAGVETISHFREEELEYTVATAAARAQGLKFIRARAVLEDVDQFDASFFGIYPREAEVMDPQHRLFLECAWESLESAGYDPEAYRGLVGVYAGVSLNTYLLCHLVADRAFAEKFTGNYQVGMYPIMLGNDKDFLPTRVSYKLNLRGPSMSIQTACSTSLVAICQACTSLLAYQCDMALAGGASISFPQKRDYLYQEDGMVSGDGTCRAFDAEARGTVFGHGVAVVLLKRLADALADRDHILAVIKGTAVNNDGSAKMGFAAPSITAQADVIAMAQAVAGVHPESISYIEAHGTGTPLGDPIEVAGLTQAFRQGGARRNGYCALGTGKTCIGHLDVAAGATGLIKTVLQLQHGQIPPLLHFKSPNPKIDFANSPFFPVAKLLDWKRGDQPRRAGVSAFGVGGTNAHVVLEESPLLDAPAPARPQQLLVLSARTETALATMTGNLALHLEKTPETALADAAFTLHRGRRAFAVRRALVAMDVPEAIARLKSLDAKSVFTAKAAQSEPEIVFLFPGQGAQYVNMGRQLYQTEPVFREHVDLCAGILIKILGVDLRKLLFPPSGSEDAARHELTQTRITQPALFVIEYALARLWMSWGIKPAALLGHSIGEYVAAVLAGVMSLEDALALLGERARLMQSLPAGGMLSVRLPEAEVRPFLSGALAIAVVNSPKLCVVSGPHAELDALKTTLEGRSVLCKTLHTSHAFHSPMMDPIVAPFTASVGGFKLGPATIPILSTVTGRWTEAGDWADPDYWGRQIRHTVRFADAVGELLKEDKYILLEVGPGQTLATLTQQHANRSKRQLVLPSMPPIEDPAETIALLAALGRLWLAGVAVDWKGFYAHEQRRRVPLPTYPFERQRYWVEPPKPVAGLSLETAPCRRQPMAPVDGQAGANGEARIGPALPSCEVTGPPTPLEEIIQEQLRLMAEQLDSLTATPRPTHLKV